MPYNVCRNTLVITARQDVSELLRIRAQNFVCVTFIMYYVVYQCYSKEKESNIVSVHAMRAYVSWLHSGTKMR
jgi:hypothetical protein